jgi:hypothetical protein
VLYRIAAVLILLFAVGHTSGFRQPDPDWKADALLTSMRSLHFDCQGISRIYWDFYVGVGLIQTVFLLFAAILAWQLVWCPGGELGVRAWPRLGAGRLLSRVDRFELEILLHPAVVITGVITLCLMAAAWLSAKPSSG